MRTEDAARGARGPGWRELAGTFSWPDGGSVANGRRQVGSGMARNRARARLTFSCQGQRCGRCRVSRRAERVIRPARAKTLCRRVFALAGRITRSARRLTLHLPQRWPWQKPSSSRALARLRALPLPDLTAAATGRHPANRTSPRTRASPVCECLLLRPLPAISP